jgi:hypothetical protein
MKLKQIIENLNKMPSTLKGFNETPKLTAEQKRKLMEMVSQYNQLGQRLRMETALIETAQTLSEISELAETYACNEASDWFATEVVKQDFKRARGISETFQKLARECHGKVQQLNALYEDMGHILGRYYEIADPVSEVFPNPSNIKSQRGLPNAQPQTIMQEVDPNESNLQSQRRLPANGPIAEVNHNEKNIKSQRNLPAGGPAPAQVKESKKEDSDYEPEYEDYVKWKKKQGSKESGISQSELDPKTKIKFVNKTVKEVAVDDKHANIKSQRNLPSGGPTPYHPPKDPKDTGSVREEVVNEVNPNTSNLQSQREFPQGGPSSCGCPKPENPSVPVKVAGSGEMNLQGQREEPQGGPASSQIKESYPKLSDIIKSIK